MMSAFRKLMPHSDATIGRRTLDVLQQLQNADPTWDCVGLACGSRVDQTLDEAKNHWSSAKTASVANDDRVDFCGPESALQLIEACASPETIVVSAIVGAAGLRPTLRAIELGVYPRSFAALNTRSRVRALTSGRSLRTSEAVASETPAR